MLELIYLLTMTQVGRKHVTQCIRLVHADVGHTVLHRQKKIYVAYEVKQEYMSIRYNNQDKRQTYINSSLKDSQETPLDTPLD